MSQFPSKPEGSYISYFSNMVKSQGGINLAQGIPGFQPPKELREALNSITDSDVHQYPPGIGNFNLIDLLYRYYSKEYLVKKDNFQIVQGATEGLSLIYTYINKKLNGNFGVLGFEPAYESYSQLPAIFGQPYFNQPLNGSYSFDQEDLKKKIRENNIKIVFVSSPGNPYGKIWSKTEVEQLVGLAEKLNFYLIFDAVYKELYFDSPPYIPLGIDSPNVFYVNSFSKMLCITGWRIGYLYAHTEHLKSLRAIHDYVGLCAPSLLQEALFAYLNSYDFGQDFVENFRKEVKNNFITLSQSLIKFGFTVPPTNGGCFVWAKLPKEINDGFNFSLSLYKQVGVAVIPGEHFSKTHINWIRLNIARPKEEINNAIDLTSKFLSEY